MKAIKENLLLVLRDVNSTSAYLLSVNHAATLRFGTSSRAARQEIISEVRRGKKGLSHSADNTFNAWWLNSIPESSFFLEVRRFVESLDLTN